MATATKTKRGFSVSCPFCSDVDAVLFVNLDEINVIRCPSCDEEFSPQTARARVTEQLATWDALIAWLDAAPLAD
jgi:Zn ribbon nucleic-acid-binding protein